MEESCEEAAVVDEVNHTAGLTDTVHAEHGSTNVDSLDSSLGSHHRANSGATE